jgi:hypothetical protein
MFTLMLTNKNMTNSFKQNSLIGESTDIDNFIGFEIWDDE